MKIVFVSDAIYPYNKGGKEKRLFELSTRLVALGHDVHIYTMHWWHTPEKSRIENGVTVHAISKYYDMYAGDRRTVKEGIMFGLACFKLIGVKFDVIDVDHMPFFPILSSSLVCLSTFRQRKYFATWHEVLTRKEWIEYMGAAGNVAYLIERICIQLPHAISASSEQTYHLLKKQRGNRNKVAIVTPGIDTTELQEVRRANTHCDVLSVSRLVKDKNLDVLINAVAILKKDKPNISCIIVGKGPEKERLKDQVDRLGLTANVILIDQLELGNDVYAYMKASKVFCLPTKREGFGMVTLEALGCGTPVVTSNASSNASRHFVSDGFNGSTVSIEASEVAKAVGYWINLPAKAVTLSKLVKEYDWTRIVSNLSKKYEEGVT